MFIGDQNKGRVIPKSYFGMHVNNALPQNKHPYNSVECPLFADLGYGLIRFWDAYVVHRLVNTANGVYDWAALDYRVNAAISAGLEIIYTFGAPPDWATSTPGPYPNYNPNPVTNINYLSTFATEVANRYRGKIKYYEIYNEVDSAGSWVGSLSVMAQYGEAIYNAVKAQDSAAIVLSPNTISWGSLNELTGMGYLREYLKLASSYCDAIAMHLYTDPSEPENYIGLSKSYIALAKSFGKESVICTETGALNYYASNGAEARPKNGSGKHVGPKMDEIQSASWISRMLICGWLGGLDGLCYYLLDNTNDTMAIDMINYSPSGQIASVKYRPALAYQYIARLLVGGKLYGFKQRGYLFSAKFVTKNNMNGIIRWCKDYRSETIDTTMFASIFDCTGAPLAKSASTAVGNEPIFCFY